MGLYLAHRYMDAVIQISCPLAHFQMSFANFLQNIEMSSFFVYVCNCSCFIRLSNMCSEPGFIFVESFQAERSRFQFKGIYVAFIFRTIPSISVT